MASVLGPMEVLCVVVVICIAVWYYLVPNHNFWKNLGVPGPKPSLIFGNFEDIILVRCSFAEALKRMCDQCPGAPLVGVYARNTPLLLLRDPDLIKDVFIKDFAVFSERGTRLCEKVEPLDAHLFSLETKRWKSLRPKLSPAFTSGKMKHMFNLILECADHFEEYLDRVVGKGEPIDCREISAKFTTDVIGSCAFGLQMNSLVNEDSEFRKMGQKLSKNNLKSRILINLRTTMPWLYELLGIPLTPKEVVDFFTKSMKETMDYRTKNNIRRADLVDILMDIKNNSEKLDFELTDSLITAQAFVFFVAGFETSSSTISHALYELSQFQDIQDKLRQEIIDSLKANNGQLTYETVKEMKYLHMVFEETLRLRPPIVFHMRQAIKDYTFRGTNITIPKKTVVWIPVWEIHQNPEYYPKPEVFDPERFTEEMCQTRRPMTYLPFGDGPRNCIGARFAVYQTKLGLIKVLANYKVEVCEKTVIPYQFDKKAIMLAPEGGIHLKFSKIN